MTEPTNDTKPAEATPQPEAVKVLTPEVKPEQVAAAPKVEPEKSSNVVGIAAMIVALASAGYTVMKTPETAPQPEPVTQTVATAPAPEVKTFVLTFDKATLCRNACLDLKRDYVTGVWVDPGCHCVQGDK